jgi:hypothetical protein
LKLPEEVGRAAVPGLESAGLHDPVDGFPAGSDHERAKWVLQEVTSMGVQDTELDDEGAPWEEFAGRHEGHPFLDLDPLYAMPERLIDLIAQYSPNFFGGDEEFEHDLSSTTEGGLFFQRQAVSCHIQRNPPNNSDHIALDQEIRALLAEEMQAAGRNKLQVDGYFQDEAQRQEGVDSRLLAYTG